MAMNTLSALQYLKVCLSHTEFEVEFTTRTRSVTIYAALSLQIKLTDADDQGLQVLRDDPGESPGWGRATISTSEYACAINTTHPFMVIQLFWRQIQKRRIEMANSQKTSGVN